MKMIVYFTYISPRSLEEGEIVEDSETKDPATAANVSFKCFLKQSFADI